jgi:hypothetical protein
MIPKKLGTIKPEFPNLVKYSQPGENYLMGPDSQHLNNSATGDEPTCPLEIKKNIQWALMIKNAGVVQVS